MDSNLMEKITKLSSMSNSSANVHEAAVASAKLNELLLRHNLTMHDVTRAHIRTTYNQQSFKLGGKDNWRRTLYHVLALNNFCKCVFISGTDKMMVVGTDENISAVGFMYDRLNVELVRLCEKEYAEADKYQTVEYINRYTGASNFRREKVHARRWKNSFMHGAVNTVHEMLKEQRKQFTNNADTNALVIDREAEVSRAALEMFGPTRRNSSSTNVNSDAYGSGKRAAGSINFNSSVSGGRQALGSGR